MKQFIADDFLLSNKTAQMLYDHYGKNMPIIDYHCHISPREIAEDKKFQNITQLWLEGDHYKWRLMRANGVAEQYITGDASDWDKFYKWAGTLERAIGNPLFHWSHLELQRYFGYSGILNLETAKEVWDLCNLKLKEEGMGARGFIRQSNVKVIGTTDDPIDDLKWHKIIDQDQEFHTRVIPMWRPDRVIEIEKMDYLRYLERLSHVSGVKIKSFQDLKDALKNRMDYFSECGCTGSDHGLLYIPYESAGERDIETIFKKRLEEQRITVKEEMQFKTACLLFLGKEYHSQNWVMQLHMGVTRNINKLMFQLLGSDTGFDTIYNKVSLEQLTKMIDQLNQTNQLPRTILYSLNPNDNASLDTLIGCFAESGIQGKIQHGSAWWFNDHETGIRDQLISLANTGVLGNFIGMLTDSRSFLSYSRHEYFRRILCDLIGEWIETGRYPADLVRAGRLIEDICYHNVKRYFNFKI